MPDAIEEVEDFEDVMTAMAHLRDETTATACS